MDLTEYLHACRRPQDSLHDATLKGAEGEFAVKVLPVNDLSLQRAIWSQHEGHMARAKSAPLEIPGQIPFSVKPPADIILDCTRLANRILNAEGQPACGEPIAAGFLTWLRAVYTDPELYRSALDALDEVDLSPEEIESRKNLLSAAVEKLVTDGAATISTGSEEPSAQP